jgi:hypothetical protein
MLLQNVMDIKINIYFNFIAYMDGEFHSIYKIALTHFHKLITYKICFQ